MLSYYRDLAFQLRQRGVDEQNVATVLKAVREEGGLPLERFGTPKEYAATFPDKGGYKTVLGGSAGRKIFLGCLYLAVLLNASNLLLKLGGDGIVDNSLILLAVSLTFVILTGVFAILVDRRIPRDFSITQRA